MSHAFSMYPFSIPWKHQKTVRYSDVFRGQRKGALGTDALTEENKNNSTVIKELFTNPTLFLLHKKYSFPLRISSGNCGFGHIYWRNINEKLHFLYSVFQRIFIIIIKSQTISWWCVFFSAVCSRNCSVKLLRIEFRVPLSKSIG